MSGWEENLSPIVRERLARIGAVTPEEMKRIEESGKLDALLAEFYTGKLDAEGLWKKLKGWKDQGNFSLLREAQVKLIDSLSFGTAAVELQKRRAAILAIESLKKHQNTSILEMGLDSIDALRKRYEEGKRRAYESVKAEVARNPQLRVEQIKQGLKTMMVQLSVDEAVKRNPQWQEFLRQHEIRHQQEFVNAIEKLKAEVR